MHPLIPAVLPEVACAIAILRDGEDLLRVSIMRVMRDGADVEDVAALCGVNRATVYRWLAGDTRPVPFLAKSPWSE